MRHPGTERLQIIRLVEQSYLPVCRTLERLGISPATFYRWYEHYLGCLVAEHCWDLVGLAIVDYACRFGGRWSAPCGVQPTSPSTTSRSW
jgi:hypothetical protein